MSSFSSDLTNGIRTMIIKQNSRAKNILSFAKQHMENPETKRLLFTGEGVACENVCTQVEIFKREMLPMPLYQWTQVSNRIDEAGKRISGLEILISKEPFEEKRDGQQCSTDERIGAALPPPKQTVPPKPVKRIQYGDPNGKPVGAKKKAEDFADIVLPLIKLESRSEKRKVDEENSFARPKKRSKPNKKA